jgi:PAS domain S-box-containing protein
MEHSGSLERARASPVRIELLIIDLMNRLLDPGPAGIDAALDYSLARLGQAFGLDRAFLFRARPDGTQFNSHEWVAPGVEALKDRMQMIDPANHLAWMAEFDAGRPVRIHNRNDLPEGLPERRFLESIGVWSSLMLRLGDGNRRLGILGYDSQTPDRIWTEDEIALLASIGRAITAVILRDEAASAEAFTRRHLEATLRAMPDLVLEISPDGRLVACHSDKLPWLSSLVRAGLGRPLLEVLPAPLAGALAEMVANPPAPQGTITRRVGVASVISPQRFEVSAAPLPSPVEGAPAGLLVTIRDLTAAEFTNAMASFREGQFTAFFEMCPHAILLNDFDTGALLDGNRAFKQTFGLDPKASPGLTLRDLMPEDTTWLLDLATEALRTRQSYGPVEASLHRADGRRFPAVLRGFMSMDPNGNRLVWALIEDVTDIRAKEAALQAERRHAEATRGRLVAAIEALDDGFAVFDAEDRLVLWNSRYVRVFAGIADLIVPGALYDDLLRAAIDRGIFGAKGERDDAALQRRLNRPLTDVWDGEDAFADGRLIWVRERSTPGRETVGIYEDVTARNLSDRRLQQVVEGGEVAVWDWDSDLGLSVMNNLWRKMLGLGPHQAGFPDLLGLAHHDDLPAVMDTRKALFDGTTDDFDLMCRLRHSDGRWVWMMSRGRVLARRADGKPRRISGVTLDVSARIEAEQRLSRLIDGARVGIWEHDLRDGVTTVSERWAEILGYRAADLSPLPLEGWLEMLHPADAKALIAHDARSFAAGQWQIEHEIRLRHREGHWVWVLSRAQAIEWDAQGRAVKTSGVNLDISAAKALEAALANERDTLSWIMETSVSGIVALDAEGLVVFANSAAEEVLHRRLVAGDDLPAILADARLADLEDIPVGPTETPLFRALSGVGVQHDIRHAIRWPDGSRRVLSFNVARLSASGTDLAVVCALTDITDAVESETRLRAAMTAAETANSAKSDFLAAMSHEMRTPLNGVLGMAGLLERQTDNPDQAAMLRVIQDSGEHLLAVINDILDLAKIEAGQLTLEPAPLSLTAVAERVLAVHRIRAEAKELRLVFELLGPQASDLRQGDEQRLVQILHNLVGNAVKFTDAGEVVLRLDARSDRTLIIEVADTGIGMSDADMARAFGDFIQVHAGTTRRYGGTGLGLAIVRRLVRLMGGEVSLSGSPGKGVVARVEIAMPVLADAPVPTPATALPQLPAIRVLAAEDNATNRIILHSMLKAIGVEAEILDSGEAVLARWQEAEFDVILLDIAMPGRDGVETLSDLNDLARKLRRPLPLALAVTANAMTHQVAGYIAQGFCGVVPKPLRPEDLARALACCVTPSGPLQ